MTKDIEQAQSNEKDLSLWRNLPSDFLWGASTSAYQIEGAISEDGRGRSIWDDFAATPGKTHLGATGEIAVDHYHRVQEDITLMEQIGVNAYCFSIAWPRVFPHGKGSINTHGLDFYDRLVDALLAHNITPVAKLYHWDLPSTLQNNGGWLNRDTAYAFADYADHVTQKLGDRIDRWVTHNEPWCTSYLGHGIGIHAPGLTNTQASVDAAHHILLSHGLAVPRIRANIRSQAQIGIALDYTPMYPIDNNAETQQAVKSADEFRNRWFFDPIFKKRYPETLFINLGVNPPNIHEGDLDIIGTPIDFLGLNYYSRWVVRSPGKVHEDNMPNSPKLTYEQVTEIPAAVYTEMDWEIFPQGLVDTLERIHRDFAPAAILITESGASFPDNWDGNSSIHDHERTHYLQQHIQSVGDAINKGIPVRGYFVWSLLDNYEWSQGFSKRFGLIYVDYPSLKHVIKNSGYWYKSFISSVQNKNKN